MLRQPDLAAELPTVVDRDRERERVDAVVRQWVSARTRDDAAATLQAAGVSAGPMLHPDEIPSWGVFVARRAFRDELHPHAATPFTLENVVFHAERVPDPPLRQAPLRGEHTEEVATELLGLDADEVAELVRRGVLEAVTPPP